MQESDDMSIASREAAVERSAEPSSKESLSLSGAMQANDGKTIGSPFVQNAKMSARDVNVFYDDKQAITDVSLDIGRNEVLAMIGPSRLR